MGDTVTEEMGVYSIYVAHGGEGDGDAPSPTWREGLGIPRMGPLPRLHTRPPAVSLPWWLTGRWPLQQLGGVLAPAFPDIQVNYTEVASICNLWRNYKDIQDSWKSVLAILDWFVKHQDILQPVAGPGHWNDPDMVPAWKERGSLARSSIPSLQPLQHITLCFSFF